LCLPTTDLLMEDAEGAERSIKNDRE
jgi:hypothetical protein